MSPGFIKSQTASDTSFYSTTIVVTTPVFKKLLVTEKARKLVHPMQLLYYKLTRLQILRIQLETFNFSKPLTFNYLN